MSISTKIDKILTKWFYEEDRHIASKHDISHAKSAILEAVRKEVDGEDKVYSNKSS